MIRPHGLEGLLRIKSYAQSEKSFLNAEVVFLKPVSEEPREYKVLSLKPHAGIFLLQLKGLNSIEDAEKYRGAQILINKDSLIKKDDDECFWYELIGLRVYLNTGRYLGTIRHILSTGSNDIYIVREENTEVLIPAIHNVIEKIDLEENKMIIWEMEGLLDLNEV
ncbi:MAG: ribosome maturation factor RimM [Thermodesulfobacteriota bacterium]|nr:ribosome maturation factor RimM [Thermodesulfobacteriota bacterium]